MTIEQIYSKHKETVFNHVLSVVKNYHDSEEVCNNVFIKMFRLECATYNEKHGTALTSWIRTITNHQILDFFRTNHQDHYKAVSDFVSSSDKNDEEDGTTIFFERYNVSGERADKKVLNAELQNKIAKAFRTLKPKYRKIAVLYFLREQEYSEIADVLNVPMGTVKGMLNRSRAMLQDALDGVYTIRTVKPEMSEA